MTTTTNPPTPTLKLPIPVSFEFFPPNTPVGSEKLKTVVQDLAAAADVDRLQLELRLDEQQQPSRAEQRHERRQHQR